MAVAGIAIEHIVGVAYERVVSLHEVVALRLLLTGLHLINGAVFECLTLLLLLGKIVEVTLVTVLREGEPIHHVTGVVEIEERHQLITDFIHHLGGDGEVEGLACYRHQLVGDGEVEGLACYRHQLVGDITYIIINKDRRLVCRQLLSCGELSETTVIGNEMRQVLGTRFHGEHHGTVHQGDILRQVRQILHIAVHREIHLDYIALLPLAVDADIR